MELVEECSEELGTDTIPGTDMMEAAWAQQATPAKIEDHVILV